MELLTKSEEIIKEFKRLINDYSEFYWTSAWAGVNFDCYNDLKTNNKKIKKIIIGIHFYQTHPDFIQEFLCNKCIKYIQQPDGTFHPKVYLFQNNQFEWELLIGSINFTSAGFQKNTETVALISNRDINAQNVYKNAMSFINNIWNKSTPFSKEELKNYRNICNNHQNKLNHLSGKYAAIETSNPIHKVEVITMSWKEYIKRVHESKELTGRIELLKCAKNLFEKYKHFKLMDETDRKAIAGILGTKDGIDWDWFGSMKGAGVFKKHIISNNEDISNALDKIPPNGDVTKNNYEEFLSIFKKIFPDGNWIATSSRLLAMKRPDVFICLDSKNKKKLCDEFGISSSNMTYERYWEEIINRIIDSVWWNSPEPKNKIEKEIWKGRSALLDALYYEP